MSYQFKILANSVSRAKPKNQNQQVKTKKSRRVTESRPVYVSLYCCHSNRGDVT
jgi:hypothetical protein